MQKQVATRVAWGTTIWLVVVFAAVPTAQATIFITMNYDNDPFLSKPELIYSINAAAATWSHWLAGTTDMQLNFDVKHDANQSLAGTLIEYEPDNDQMVPRALWKYRNDQLNDDERDGTFFVNADRDNWYAPGREVGEDFLTWYVRTGGKTPAGHYDLTTVAIHEMAHALGMASSYDHAQTRWGEDDDGTLKLVPWDTFLRDENDNAPTAGTGGAFNVTGDLSFDGFRAQVYFQGPVPIYSPDPFEGGSSLAHTSVADVSNSTFLIGISNPFANQGFARHGLLDFEQAMFEDLGWEFRTPANLHINTWWGQRDIREALDEAGDTIPTAQWHDGTHWWGTDSSGELLRGLPPTPSTDVVFHMQDAQSKYILGVYRYAEVQSLRMGGSADAKAVIEIHDATLRVNSEQFATIIGDQTSASSEILVTGFESRLEIEQNLTVGQFGFGTLRIRDGSVENEDGIIAWGADAVGVVSLVGAASTWINSGTLSVGYAGSGDLAIQAGAVVSDTIASVGHNPNSQGTAWVEGQGSSWLSDEIQVGSAGDGSLLIETGGEVSSALATIGTFSTGVGRVNLRGDGATWTNTGQLSVGAQGEGRVGIESGGRVTSARGFIGTFANSLGDAIVAGAGSTWTNNEFIIVGFSGEGRLVIDDGGSVSQPNAIIAYGPGSTGSVTVAGAGSNWNNNSLIEVGRGGTGTLTVARGGRVQSAFGFIGSTSNSAGIAMVTGAGSEWQASGSLFVGGDSVQAGGAGTLTLSDGAVVSANTVQIWMPGTLGGDGAVDANVINGGRVRPGNSAGVLDIVGNYTQQVGATLEIELGGTTPALQYDSLAVSGAATLGGTLLVSLINGFTPTAGNSFQILLANGGLTGTFVNEVLPALATNLMWRRDYSSNSIQLAVMLSGGALPGDYNHNGTVDAADYVVWRNSTGQTGPGLAADGNGNNQIDAGDYTVWRANFGRTAATGSGATGSARAAVAEPASLTLLVVAASIGVRRLPRGRVSDKLAPASVSAKQSQVSVSPTSERPIS